VTLLAWCVLLGVFGCAADVCVKKAANGHGMHWAVVGASVYALGTFGWVRAMRLGKLSTVAPLYASVIVCLTVAAGLVVFGEKLRGRDFVGIALAVSAIFVLRDG